MMENLVKIFCGIVVAIGIALAIAAFIGLPVMWLWNWLMPDLFALKAIGFWQAVGLALLCGLLFKTSSSTNK